jgi:hypothetical protein
MRTGYRLSIVTKAEAEAGFLKMQGKQAGSHLDHLCLLSRLAREGSGGEEEEEEDRFFHESHNQHDVSHFVYAIKRLTVKLDKSSTVERPLSS